VRRKEIAETIETEARAVLALCKPGRHPNILGVFKQGVFLDSVFPGYFFDMELCDINLERYMLQHCQGSETPMAIIEIWDVMMQVATGTAFIHQQGKVHRDLKPRNGINSLKLYETPTDFSAPLSSKSFMEDRRLRANRGSDVQGLSHD
jgi:serine/threonine protein kinase